MQSRPRGGNRALVPDSSQVLSPPLVGSPTPASGPPGRPAEWPAARSRTEACRCMSLVSKLSLQARGCREENDPHVSLKEMQKKVAEGSGGPDAKNRVSLSYFRTTDPAVSWKRANLGRERRAHGLLADVYGGGEVPADVGELLEEVDHQHARSGGRIISVRWKIGGEIWIPYGTASLP